MISDGCFIHQKAHIDVKSVSVGTGTKIWQFASLIRGADVGEYCVIGACAIVDGAKVGDRCLIGHGASIHPSASIGNDVFVGPGAVFCNDVWPSTSKEGFDVSALHSRTTIIVEDGASIGANAVILPGVRIGAGAIVAAGMVCDEDVPASAVLRRDGTFGRKPEKMDASRRMRFAA